MKKIIYFLLVSFCLIVSINSECFKKDAKEGECEGRKTSGKFCCFVNYRTNKDPNYKTACVEVIKEDIKKGHHEATIPLIEKGNYTNSGWPDEVMELFRDYSSIRKFDCKSNYLTISFLAFISFVLNFF